MTPRELQQAALWHERLHGTPDASTEAAFREWYHSEERHRLAFAAIVAVDEVAAGQPALRSIGDAALRRVANRRHRRRYWGVGALVTTIVVAPVAALGIRYWQAATAPAVQAPAARVFTTQVGERRLVALGPTTRALLDTASRITVTGSTIRVDGQAYVSGGGRPVQIALPGGMGVTVTGNANVRADAARAALFADGTDASIRAGAAGQARPLASGDMLSIAGGRATTTVPADPAALTSWRSGWLFFDDVPLGQAAAEINRYRHVPIRLTARTGALRISGSFRTDDSAGFLRTVAATLPATIDHAGSAPVIDIATATRK